MARAARPAGQEPGVAARAASVSIRAARPAANLVRWAVRRQFLLRRRVAWLLGCWVDALRDPAPR